MTDPIFAGIDKHKRLREAHLAALASNATHAPEVADLEISSWEKLLATRAATLAGLAAMLEYVAAWQGRDDAAYADTGDLLAAIHSAAESARIIGRSIATG